MIRFAYPNVSQQRFIGCGHYLSLPSGQEPPPGYTAAQPQYLNQAEVEAAAACLVPELNDSEAGVCGPCDERSQGFGGRSQALAYLLARIGGVRHLRAEHLPTAQDIWCTGAIALPDGARSPLVEAVFDDAFVPKLDAFLAASEPRLFLVPAANLTAALKRLCTAAGAEWLSLSSFRSRSHQASTTSGTHKTVITIARDELHVLVDTLCEPPRSHAQGVVPRRTGHGRVCPPPIGIGLLLVLLMLLGGDGVPTLWQRASKSPSPPVAESGATHQPPTPPPSSRLSDNGSPQTPQRSLGPSPYVYITKECQYFSLKEELAFKESFAAPQLVLGDRLEVHGEEGDHYRVRAYDGSEGYILKSKVQSTDPKVYFAGTLKGKPVTGFLRGPWHCSYLHVLPLKIGDGEFPIPIARIAKLKVDAGVLTVWNDDGSEPFVVDKAPWSRWGSPADGGLPGRFIYGPYPSITSGTGVELGLSPKVEEPLILERIRSFFAAPEPPAPGEDPQRDSSPGKEKRDVPARHRLSGHAPATGPDRPGDPEGAARAAPPSGSPPTGLSTEAPPTTPPATVQPSPRAVQPSDGVEDVSVSISGSLAGHPEQMQFDATGQFLYLRTGVAGSFLWNVRWGKLYGLAVGPFASRVFMPSRRVVRFPDKNDRILLLQGERNHTIELVQYEYDLDLAKYPSLDFDPDGTVLLYDTKQDKIVDFTKPKASFQIAAMNMQEPVEYAVFSPDRQYLALGTSGQSGSRGVISLVSLQTLSPVFEVQHGLNWHGGGQVQLFFSADSRRLFGTTREGVSVWEVPTGKPLRQLGTPSNNSKIALMHGGSQLVVHDSDRIDFFEVETGSRIDSVTAAALSLPRGLQKHFFAVSVSPDETLLAVGGHGFVSLWHLPSRRPLYTVVFLTNGRDSLARKVQSWILVKPGPHLAFPEDAAESVRILRGVQGYSWREFAASEPAAAERLRVQLDEPLELTAPRQR